MAWFISKINYSIFQCFCWCLASTFDSSANWHFLGPFIEDKYTVKRSLPYLPKVVWLVKCFWQSLMLFQSWKTIILWNIITILNICFLCEYIFKLNLFLWCKAEFLISIITPVFSVTWSFRNHSNVLWCSRKMSYHFQYLKQLWWYTFLWKP